MKNIYIGLTRVLSLAIELKGNVLDKYEIDRLLIVYLFYFSSLDINGYYYLFNSLYYILREMKLFKRSPSLLLNFLLTRKFVTLFYEINRNHEISVHHMSIEYLS